MTTSDPTATDPTATEQYTLPAIGGVRFDADASHDVYAYGDRAMIDPVVGSFAFESGTAYLGLTTQDSSGAPITTVDEFLARLDRLPIEATGHSIELFGYQLAGYSTEHSGSGTNRDPALFASTRIGTESRHTWSPDRDLFYLADTAAGVLYAGYDTGGSPENPVARGAFEMLLETAELTGPPLRDPLPPGSNPRADGPAPSPAAVIPDGPAPLQVSFADTSPGVYQLPNFGQQISITTTGWQVRPNQPGIVALAKPNSAGPGDGAVVFMGGLAPLIVPQSGGPLVGGEPVDLSDIQAFLDDPPSNLVVSDVDEVAVGGLRAIRFDVRVDPGASCAQDEPCEFAFRPTWPWNFPVAIQATLSHRIWWFPEHPSGVAMIHASDLDPAFLDQASEFVASIEPVG